MNNILVSSTIDFNKEGTYKLELEKDTNIIIETVNVKLYLVTEDNIKVNIKCLQSTSIYNITKGNFVFDINIYNNSKLNFYNMSIIDKKITNKINIYHQNKETISNVICHGISYDKGDLTFIINGYIKKGMINSLCNQSSRIINLGKGKSKIEPNLFIEEFASTANHSAYTGPFNESLLFYLETKGISKKEAFNLLLKGFIKIETLPKDYEKYLDNILDKVIRR